MIFSSVRIRNYRSISDTTELPLGPVTVVVGRNNSGKSSLLRAVYMLQEGGPFRDTDIRVGANDMRIDVRMKDVSPLTAGGKSSMAEIEEGMISAIFSPGNRKRMAAMISAKKETVSAWPSVEPGNLIYPILSGRTQNSYEQQVSRDQAFSVSPTDTNIISRVAALVSSDLPEAEEFRRLCQEILNINLSVLIGEHGQRVGTPISRFRGISLEAMGSGIASVLNLLVSLCGAKGRLFLVEEPENDLHPSALKALLSAMEAASSENQFIVSTHSSIVLGRLGSLPGTVVLKAAMDADRPIPPESSYEVIDTPDGRLDVLRHLGYELADFDLGEGWLIFEESSAEQLAREWLIPWFAPGLRRLRTLGATGTGRVEPIMQDFREMFLFAHLEPVYKNRAWVVVDGDESGREAVRKLRSSFKGWNPENFRNWDKGCIEEYFPALFSERVSQVLTMPDKGAKRRAKSSLLKDVLSWIEANEGEARESFKESADGVISHLRIIESQLKGMHRI